MKLPAFSPVTRTLTLKTEAKYLRLLLSDALQRISTMSGDKEHIKQEFAALGGHLSTIVNRIRKSAVKNTTGGTSSGTSVKSTFGYLRWSSDHNDETPKEEAHETDELNTSLAQDPSEIRKYDGAIDYDDETSAPSEKSSIKGGEAHGFKSSQSNTSLDMPSEPATNTDTITEWQAGWNVTNAIQVSHYTSCNVHVFVFSRHANFQNYTIPVNFLDMKTKPLTLSKTQIQNPLGMALLTCAFGQNNRKICLQRLRN